MQPNRCENHIEANGEQESADLSAELLSLEIAQVMSPMMNTLMLICASLAALAFGVLSAHALCRAGFGILRAHASSVARGRAAALSTSAASKPALATETA
jgi:hypothetical protein